MVPVRPSAATRGSREAARSPSDEQPVGRGPHGGDDAIRGRRRGAVDLEGDCRMRPGPRSGGRCAGGCGGAGTWVPAARRARIARRSPRRSSYTWTSARPSPGWPRGTTSRPPQNWPIATTTVVRRAREPRRGRRAAISSVEAARLERRDAVGRRARRRHMLTASCPSSEARATSIGSSVPAAASPAPGRVRGPGRPRARGRSPVGDVPDQRARRAPRRQPRARASSPCTSRSGGRRGGPAPGLPLLDHRLRRARATTLEAAMTPRRHASAAARAVGGGGGVGCDVGDLAQQVDRLLDVADEVAAGHLLVLEDVGEVVAASPRRGSRPVKPGIGPAGLGQPLVALGQVEVAPDAFDRRATRCATSGARPPARRHRLVAVGTAPLVT